MSRTIPRRFRKLVTHVESLGWTVSFSGGGHLKWVPPEGWTTGTHEDAQTLFTAATPSDRRAIKNICAMFKKQGIDATQYV